MPEEDGGQSEHVFGHAPARSERGTNMDIRTSVAEAINGFKKDCIEEGMTKIYKKIYSEVKDVSAEQLAMKITACESREVNSFLLDMDSNMGELVSKVLSQLGVEAEAVPFIWPELRRTIPLPKIKLCNQNPSAAPVKAASPDAGAQSASAADSWGKWVLIAGTVVEVIAWLFVPAVGIWQPIVKGIGLVAIGIGGVRVYQEMNAKPHITLTEKALEEERKQARQQVKDLCIRQCGMNVKILKTWADSIGSALIAAAEKALADK